MSLINANAQLKWAPGTDHSQIRAVIYVRVSHDPNGTGRSTGEQETECRKIVHREGWTLIWVYCDEDKSASEDTKDKRADWELLTQALARGDFDVLVVWEPSRATRDRQAWAALAYACEETGTRICANGKVYDLAEPDEAFALDIFFALARRESKVTRKRVQRTVSSRAQEGLPGPGKAPFGYRRIYDKSTGAVVGLEPDDVPRTATTEDGVTTIWRPDQLVIQLFKDVTTNITAYSCAQKLNNLGIPNPRTLHAMEHHPERERKYSSRWDPNMIRNLLANPAYLGHRSHRGKIVAEAKWRALIDIETFANAAIRASTVKFPGPRVGAARHLLSRIAICDECSTPLQATKSSQQLAYRCRNGRSFVAMGVLDQYVTRWVIEWLSIEANIAQLRDTEDVSTEIMRARADAELYSAELAAAKAAFHTRQIDLDDYAAVRAELMNLIAEAERRAQMSGIPPLLRAVAGPKLAQEFEGMALSTRREIVQSLVEVRLLSVGRGRRQGPIHELVVMKPLLGSG